MGVAVITWNVSGWRARSKQQSANDDLRQRLAAARGSTSPDHAAGGESLQTAGLPVADGKVDWKRVAGRMQAMDSQGLHIGDTSLITSLEEHIGLMSDVELIAAIRAIAAMEGEQQASETLQEMLAGRLIEIAPELALQTFTSRISDDEDPVGWQLPTALGEWAKLDPGAATAWLDRQIADGHLESKSLDGVSQSRLEFEAALAGVMLHSDPAAARQRIAALAVDQRRDALERISFIELDATGRRNFAAIARETLAQDERADVFGSLGAELLLDGGLPSLDAFMDEIRATPDERDACAREAANTHLSEIAGERAVTRDDVDTLRAWLQRQAPDAGDRMIGTALAEAVQDDGDFDFNAAAQLALGYHQQGGNDELLAAFLDSFTARTNPTLALPLLEHIRDPELRRKLRENLE